ncbi:MAG: SxtJ family membrane protein [Nitrospinota bacterium]|nr:SxtJ family membrane protein [Nitrospinota bacterium]
MAIGESKREVTITWIGFTVIMAVIGSVLLFKQSGAYVYFYALSAFFAIFAAAAPMALLPFYRVWVKFAMKLAWVNTRLILGLVFYLAITPLGLIMRLFGTDFLDERLDRKASTYWKKKTHETGQARYSKPY